MTYNKSKFLDKSVLNINALILKNTETPDEFTEKVMVYVNNTQPLAALQRQFQNTMHFIYSYIHYIRQFYKVLMTV